MLISSATGWIAKHNVICSSGRLSHFDLLSQLVGYTVPTLFLLCIPHEYVH